jgi:nicotinamide-nucleotide amidase
MDKLTEISQRVGELLNNNAMQLATAESCTGGGISSTITEVAGSSAWFDRAFITYSNESKVEMLGVLSSTLDQWGAVSEQTAIEMAKGALTKSSASIACSVTGIAGPTGGTVEKPVGMVCFCWIDDSGWVEVETVVFAGTRREIRNQTIYHALQVIENKLLCKKTATK